jgi:hypothetical protein
MREEWAEHIWGDGVSLHYYLVYPFVERALAAWQADREALEAAQGQILRVVARGLEDRALLRRAREALREDQHDADTTYKIAAGTDVRSLAARIKHRTEQVLAELDAAQGEGSKT